MPAMWPQILMLTGIFAAELKTAASTSGQAPKASSMPGMVPKMSIFKGSTAKFMADHITAQYQLMHLYTQTTFGHLIAPRGGGWNKKAFKYSWTLGFLMQANNAKSMSIAPYTLMAAGTVQSWVPKSPMPPGLKFLPMPTIPSLFPGPHPAPPTGAVCHSVFPGSPTPLNAMIMAAFNSGSAYTIAPILADAFMKHLMTITGVYWGMMPSPAGPPVPNPAPMPWTGVI